jgi:hypothetical protein
MNVAWCFLLIGMHNCNLCKENYTKYYRVMLGKFNDGIREEFCGSMLTIGLGDGMGMFLYGFRD